VVHQGTEDVVAGGTLADRSRQRIENRTPVEYTFLGSVVVGSYVAEGSRHMDEPYAVHSAGASDPVVDVRAASLGCEWPGMEMQACASGPVPGKGECSMECAGSSCQVGSWETPQVQGTVDCMGAGRWVRHGCLG
jgi:hypothetical protein